MKLITAIIWLIAAAAALYNAVSKHENGIWVLIAVVFAANGIRLIANYIKEKKQSEEE